MTFATHVSKRYSRRSLALVSALAVLMSLMTIYATPAQAHHPEITASQGCVEGEVVINYTSTSWLTSGDPGSGHDDIRIEARISGGSWSEVGSGAYTSANGYSFAGSFDGSDLSGDEFWNTTVEIRAYADGDWDNDAAGGQYSSSVEVKIDQDCFNPSCPSDLLQLKLEGGSLTSGEHGPNDEFTIAIDGTTFDWTSTVPVFQVIAKGGPGANVYNYPGGGFSGEGLHAPTNPKNGKYYGLSHITLCYQEGGQDEPVEVTVTGGACSVGQQGMPAGSAEVTIDPDSGATVTIYTNSDMTGEVASVTESGSVDDLAPGTYYWEADSASGFDIEGSSSGEFTIDPCDVNLTVTGTCEVVDNDAVGTIEVTVSVPGSVTVEIPGVGTFTESDTATVAAGATYPWSATPDTGFAISGDSSGEVEIEDCTPEPPPTDVGASIVPTVAGGCLVVDGQGQGVINVVIPVDGGATVVISDADGAIETFTSDGSVNVTAGATYTWEATPNEGFEFPPDFAASGTITIEDCTPIQPPPPASPDDVMASILVTVEGTCEDGDGFVGVNLSVDGGATVVVTDADGDVMGRLSSDGTITVPEGASYNWVATPSEGFEFPADFPSSGTITIERCSVPDTLPFTGMDLDVAAAFAAAFLGAGITVLASQWRREEQ